MKPLTLKIKNVRSYKEANIDFGNAKLIYYFGLNGSGKTTIARSLLFLIGMEPEDGDIRLGEDRLEVEGLFDVSDISTSLLPREDVLHIEVEKETGKRAHYRIGEDRRRISHRKIADFFASQGASPSQVFIQMGSIPLPFRSAVEEHIKKKGLLEHRRKRFSALMDLMGIRDFIGILEEKKLDYDRVMEIYKEAKLDLIDASRNFELIKTKYERFLEYQNTKKEIEKLKRLRKIVEVSTLIKQLRKLAEEYGKRCRERKGILKEIEEKEISLRDIEKIKKRLSAEHIALKKEIEKYEAHRGEILSSIGKIDGELSALGQVHMPTSDKFLGLSVPQIEIEIRRIEDEIKKLSRQKGKLLSKVETLKGQRESISSLLLERKEELEVLIENVPDPVDEETLRALENQIATLRKNVSDIRKRKKMWEEKLKNSPVVVKDDRYLTYIADVLATFMDKDVAPITTEIEVNYPSLDQFVETDDEDLFSLLKRVFVVPDKRAADKVRGLGALAIVDDEMWDWWGMWNKPKTVPTLALSSEKFEDTELSRMEEKLAMLESKYSTLKKKFKEYHKHQDKIRFIKADIEALEKKLESMDDPSKLMVEVKQIEDKISLLEKDKKLAETTRRYLRYLSLKEKKGKLQEKLKIIKEVVPDKSKVEDIVARLSSISSDEHYLSNQIGRLKGAAAKLKREMTGIRSEMMNVSARLSAVDRDILKEAVSYDGDATPFSIDRQIALLRAKLEGMGYVEDVSARYREMEKTLEAMKNRFSEVEKWQAEALEDLINMKESLTKSIMNLQTKITEVFSEFLSTFGFDGKIEIHLDTDAPRTVGEVYVSVRSSDGVWNDYDVMRLSGGEGILVAFSLYLAAWMVKTGNVHFLMIDEAQTNLDSMNFSRLLNLLVEKVPGQIHIFTMVEPPQSIAERDDTIIYHVMRNVFDMSSEVLKIE